MGIYSNYWVYFDCWGSKKCTCMCNSGAWLVTSTNDMSHFTRCHCHGGGSLTGAIRWKSRTCTPTSWPSSLTRRENGSLARGQLWKSMDDEVSFIAGYEACSQFDCTFKNYIKLGYVLCRCRCHSLDSTGLVLDLFGRHWSRGEYLNGEQATPSSRNLV